jgi:putative aldouronate transport system substrate-binding protein
LQASCADLTPYLSGDAVKDYPNLAAYPTNSWKPTVFNGSIYAVPNVRAPINYVWYVNQNLMDQAGAQPPKSADDFKRLVQEFTRPQANQYGIGAGAPAYGLQNNGRGDVPMLSMFGAPNNWSVDSSGKFTKDIESEQFKAALGFVRDLYALGVYWPDPVPLNSVVLKTNYLAGRIGIISTGWISFAIEFWDPGLKLNPPMRPRVFAPFEANGGKPMWHQTQGNAGMMVLKKGTPERTKELLRILNYLSAPFGSQEALLINYGVKDIDYTPDEKGNPVKTPQGNADTSVPWLFVATSLPVLFDSNDASFVPTAYPTAQSLMENLVPDPTAGLYSSTDATKGPVVLQKFNDGLGEIVTGTAPLSNLTQLLQDWRSGGGDQIRMEYEKSYADAQK